MSTAGPPTVTARRVRVATLVAVLGPGLLAGLSDDDPAGITTYSVLGASYGYQLLWVLLLSTVALVVFHSLGARMGVVTGQGLIGLIRQRYGVRASALALVVLVLANVGTTCAEFAGIAAGFGLFHVPPAVSVPISAVVVSTLVLRGRFHRVEHLLMGLATVFVAYVAAGFLAHPDWGQAATGLVLPTMPLRHGAVLIVTATVGTTLAPWGLSFIQSYAVDKKLTTDDLGYERVDVITGAVLTGVIGFFVVVASAATLHAQGVTIESASDAAGALEPLAGPLASTLFALGLVGAALLAAAILPLSTAYSICEFAGAEAALDDDFEHASLFYVSYLATAAVGAGVVLAPGLPLIRILVLSQVLNAVLLLPLLGFMFGIARDRDLMGQYAATRSMSAVYAVTLGLVALCIGALLALGLP
ncbi:Mn2+/Fe2+ NRAMP family transporter [Nocardioides ginsengisegetis]|uniref:Mn2+/Fe2+ NRAMP family transporter n=1 Tax=Nocardioides ginsengisegetis TaxID=661491 RepID=A0A7W3P9C6_9ACTN|nr:divalent metal cation transporter [Nocardioides ginsengisegetis]MBA8803309.1 Mn2+/Fe2+ NRAMP family transporter [Nocardioides ginsengisegetis]